LKVEIIKKNKRRMVITMAKPKRAGPLKKEEQYVV
jgi:hypothetical protein